MDNNETAWVSGLLEGEGSFVINGQNKLTVICQMTDEDIIYKLHKIAGIGSVTKPKLIDGHKQTWRWQVSNRRQVVEFISKILPFMGKRRGQKINDMIQHFKTNPPKRQEKGKVEHGTRTKYARGCRCMGCRIAEHNYQVKIGNVKSTEFKKIVTKDECEHGTFLMYNKFDCRCDSCKEFMRAQWRKQNVKKSKETMVSTN